MECSPGFLFTGERRATIINSSNCGKRDVWIMKKYRITALALALVLVFAGLGVFPAAFAAD